MTMRAYQRNLHAGHTKRLCVTADNLASAHVTHVATSRWHAFAGQTLACFTQPAGVQTSQWFPFVMVGLVPTILYARSGALLDPRDKPEDDTCTFWCAGSTSRVSSSASSSGMPRR